MSFKLHLKRDTRTPSSTGGKLYLNEEYFGYTLEDIERPWGEKVPGQTAIPAGRYKVKVTESWRFKRKMPMIYSEPNGYELKAGGISFKGIRIHGGNKSTDSEGCILLARQRVDSDTIYGSLEKELTDRLLELGGEGEIVIDGLIA